MAQATATQSALMTAEELLLLPGDLRCELVEGELVEMSPPGGEHGDIGLAIGSMLRLHVRASGAGRAFGEAGFVLRRDPDTVRAPDAAFMRSERLPAQRAPVGYVEGAPDLAVEVVSPHDTAREIDTKVREYLAAGTRLVWVVYPEGRYARVFRADNTTAIVEHDESLSGEDVLPGLEIPLSEVFA
jgi:Uma2 family endonuclease